MPSAAGSSLAQHTTAPKARPWHHTHGSQTDQRVKLNSQLQHGPHLNRLKQRCVYLPLLSVSKSVLSSATSDAAVSDSCCCSRRVAGVALFHHSTNSISEILPLPLVSISANLVLSSVLFLKGKPSLIAASLSSFMS